ncbi:MAG: hypothetical protein CMH90_02390 [Oceanicaulis sp.]|uniref:hypothetical protein n=1 Tax=Oceanicaulis sp. UBA2681 TaxID=1947007 RepID=UPI000C0B6D80|nr:hypothetical protein [Oceanicaulis sp. UBA2681]MAP48307.1 hypothetical protein [Oceanicaulis sp.]|tara:strand:+ start:12372 stop:12764 length:393 start_codon:yes stop_codon:yes gene_type:complete
MLQRSTGSAMSLRLKRWTYRINRHDIVLECGYTLWGWAQARLSVDGDRLVQTSGCRFWPLTLDSQIKTAQPPMPLKAIVTPGFLSVHSELWAYGVPASAPVRAVKGWLDAPRGAWPESRRAAQNVQKPQS